MEEEWKQVKVNQMSEANKMTWQKKWRRNCVFKMLRCSVMQELEVRFKGKFMELIINMKGWDLFMCLSEIGLLFCVEVTTDVGNNRVVKLEEIKLKLAL